MHARCHAIGEAEVTAFGGCRYARRRRAPRPRVPLSGPSTTTQLHREDAGRHAILRGRGWFRRRRSRSRSAILARRRRGRVRVRSRGLLARFVGAERGAAGGVRARRRRGGRRGRDGIGRRRSARVRAVGEGLEGAVEGGGVAPIAQGDRGGARIADRKGDDGGGGAGENGEERDEEGAAPGAGGARAREREGVRERGREQERERARRGGAEAERREPTTEKRRRSVATRLRRSSSDARRDGGRTRRERRRGWRRDHARGPPRSSSAESAATVGKRASGSFAEGARDHGVGDRSRRRRARRVASARGGASMRWTLVERLAVVLAAEQAAARRATPTARRPAPKMSRR